MRMVRLPGRCRRFCLDQNQHQVHSSERVTVLRFSFALRLLREGVVAAMGHFRAPLPSIGACKRCDQNISLKWVWAQGKKDLLPITFDMRSPRL